MGGIALPKRAAELGALQVGRMKAPGLHAVGGVPGLRLQVTGNGARSWVLRAVVDGKRSEKGLGSFPTVSLAAARESARAMRAKIAAGVNPIAEGKAVRAAQRAARVADLTFEQCAERFIAAKSPEWKSAKHAAQWTATLSTYAYPTIGKLRARDIALPHILTILEPIWSEKTETATRLRARLESVLDWATTRGHRDGPNPARWKGHLENLLPMPGKIAKVKHHAALPVAHVAAFMAQLRSQAGVGARALEFAILTAARSGEVRGARWAEVDLEAALWVVPGDRMKAGREHRVPLSTAAVAVLRGLPRMTNSDFLFPAAGGGGLSDMTLSAVMRRMKAAAVPHGFRSTFRDWCSECTDYSREVAEMALAHAIPDQVEAAYRRGDLFEKRRNLMSDWAKFCAGECTHAKHSPLTLDSEVLHEFDNEPEALE